MFELRDIADVATTVLVAVTGWLLKSIHTRPTYEEVRMMLQDNQKINNATIEAIKDDVKELKESNKSIQKQLDEVKEMLYKALYKS